MPYDVKVIGNESMGDNILYKVRITDLTTLDQRDIRVRYSQLYDLHTTLQNDNAQYQLPSFPKKDFFKSVFGNSQQQVKNREQQLSQYFNDILKNPPPQHRSLIEFLRDGPDALRLQTLNKEVSSKVDFMKNMVLDKVLKKGQFGKTSLLTGQGGRKLILHKFYVIAQQCEQNYNQYLKTHLGITEFNLIAKVHSIFQIKQKQGLFDSLIGAPKMPKVSKTKQPFKCFYPNNTKLEAVKIYSIEEYEGINLDEIINQRKSSTNYFTLDELLNFAQKLLQAILFLQKRNIVSNKIFGSNILIKKDQVKLTGVNEPNQSYKEKYLIEGHGLKNDQQYECIYYPQERWDQYHQAYNPYKIDSWQYGICLTKAALLMTNKNMDGIVNSQSVLKQLMDQIQNKYGEVIARIVEFCLKSNSQNRADLKDIQVLVNQTSIIPFEHKYINTYNNKKHRLCLKSLHDFSEITEFIEQKQQSQLILKINLNDQIINHLEMDKAFQFIGNICELIELNLIVSKTKNFNPTALFSSLENLKSIQKLIIDFKYQSISYDDILYMMEYLKQQQQHLQYLVIDFGYCQFDKEQCKQTIHDLLSQLSIQNKLYF